jgi:hypothetical protein
VIANRLRHSVLAKQHLLDALTLRLRHRPVQRRYQFPDLPLGASAPPETDDHNYRAHMIAESNVQIENDISGPPDDGCVVLLH